VISELDIRRGANLLIREYGENEARVGQLLEERETSV
jgi:hypothetical protein